jgi:hypothetical protein
MLINLKIGEFYKVENKMSALCVTDDSTRVFEKKDYAFPITDILDGFVYVDYLGDKYRFEYGHARHNFRKALTSKDIEQYIVLKYITGSRAYGTNVPTSDTDYKAVFIFPDSYYSMFDFNPDWEEIKEKNMETNEETTYYSMRKFISLLAVNNPNMLEVFDIPDDCLVYKHPEMDILLKRPEVFLSKLCYKAFLGYGESQIRKADGQDKLNNWEKEKMERKGPLDFCYTFVGQGSVPIEQWLSERGMEQRFCALNAVEHMRDMYGVYYDRLAHTIVYLKEIIEGARPATDIKDNDVVRGYLGELNGGMFSAYFADDPERTLEWVKSHGLKMLGYKGIVLDDSDTIRLSKTPKDAVPMCYMSYNKDGFMSHCKLYNRYMTWRRERNEARWIDVEGHNQKIDGKNMLHCMRLIYMSEDIAAGRGIIVRRPEAEYLKSIRYGKVELNKLMDDAAQKLKDLGTAFEQADLMDEPDSDKVAELYNDTVFAVNNYIAGLSIHR